MRIIIIIIINIKNGENPSQLDTCNSSPVKQSQELTCRGPAKSRKHNAGGVAGLTKS